MISIIAAMDKNGKIGKSGQNQIPWNCKVDQELFRARTMGDTVLVGRKTWESLPESVKSRENQIRDERNFLVMSKSMGSLDLKKAHGPWRSFEELIDYFKFIEKVGYESYTDEYDIDETSIESAYRDISPRVDFHIAGGASIYEQAIEKKIADHAFLTRIPIESGCDIEWPGLTDDWQKYRTRELRIEMISSPLILEEWKR